MSVCSELPGRQYVRPICNRGRRRGGAAYYTTHRSRPLPPDVDTRGYTQGCDLCQLACPFNRHP